MSISTEIYGKSFAGEAMDRFPEKIVTKAEQIDIWVAQGASSGELVNNLARMGNPVWQSEVQVVRPPVIYGTVDGAGNVSELLMMQSMADRLHVPLVLLLDDNAYNVADTYRRLTEPSLGLLGIGSADFDLSQGHKKFHQVIGEDVLPLSVKSILKGSGLDISGLTLAEIYRQVLYLLAVDIYGDSVLNRLSIVPVTSTLDRSVVGSLPLMDLQNKVQQIARELGKSEMVFVHDKNMDKINSRSLFDPQKTVNDLYQEGGWLGGTAWVTLTTLLTNKQVFSEGGSAIMAEKDTTLGVNFAKVYEVLNRDLPESAMKVAISAVRRIKADFVQGGGDGIDPVLMYCLLHTSSKSQLIVEMIREHIGSAFPMQQGFDKEKQLVLTDIKTMSAFGARILKQNFGIDGNYLKSLGVQGKTIGQVLNQLTSMYIEGSLSMDSLNEIISSIK